MTRVDSERLRARLQARPRNAMKLDGFRESAVLVPILSEPELDDALVFTVRQDSLPTHAGQISFPGGKRDPGDADLAATAIRETSEELGVDPSRVEVLGLLDDVPTPTGFVITPVVARIAGPVELRPSAKEVAAVFRCPFEALQRPDAFRENGVRTFMGITYMMLEYHYEQHRIWGATARIVHQLLSEL